MSEEFPTVVPSWCSVTSVLISVSLLFTPLFQPLDGRLAKNSAHGDRRVLGVEPSQGLGRLLLRTGVYEGLKVWREFW